MGVMLAHPLFGVMVPYIAVLALHLVTGVEVKQADSQSLLELQSSWARREDIEAPAVLLRSERRMTVSEEGQISDVSDDPSNGSIEELLKDELAKQEKEARERADLPKVVGCVGTEKGAAPHGFAYPENYPSDPAWTVKSIWSGNRAGLYGSEVQNARYMAVTLAEQQPIGGYYYLVFGDELSEIGTKLNLSISQCDYGHAKSLKMGARPDSEPRSKAKAEEDTWGGTTWRVYENPVPREVRKKPGTLFPTIQFPSLDPKPNASQLAFTRDQTQKSENSKDDQKPKADLSLSKLKGLSAATTTPKATLHNEVQEIKETLQGLVGEIQALKLAPHAHSADLDWRWPSPQDVRGETVEDEEVVDIKDLYLFGRVVPKSGHFQIDADGSSGIHQDGMYLRLDPGTSPTPTGGNNDLVVNLYGYACSKFYGALRISKDRPEGANGVTFFTFQDDKKIGSVQVGGRSKKDFSFRYSLNPEASNMSLRVQDHGTPDKDFFEVEGYLSCKVNCTARALDTDTGSCESLTDDRVRCEGAADPEGRPCQWNGATCLGIESGRCSRETLCHEVLDGTNDCQTRTDYDTCTQRTDGAGALCGWKDKEQKCFASNFNCKASHGPRTGATTTEANFKEHVTEGEDKVDS